MMIIGGCDLLDKKSPPWADFTITPDSGTTFTDFAFEMTYLHDDDTPPASLLIRWDFDGDSIWDTEFLTGKAITHRFAKPGNQVAFCEVRDEDYMSCIIAKPLPVKVDYYDLTPVTDFRIYFKPKFEVIQIGAQVWIKSNMQYRIVDHSWAYEDNYTYRVQFGYLYDWEGAQQACIPGFHLPTDEEWKTLERYLGMEDNELNLEGDRKSGNVASKLKDIKEWTSINGKNSSGFSAWGGGQRNNDGSFEGIYNQTSFWTSTPSGNSAWVRTLRDDPDTGVIREKKYKNMGLSVRCIRTW